MKISTKQWFILSIIIIVVADFIINWILNIKILSWIWQKIVLFFSFQITLPLWIVILLFLILFLSYFWIKKIIMKKSFTPDKEQELILLKISKAKNGSLDKFILDDLKLQPFKLHHNLEILQDENYIVMSWDAESYSLTQNGRKYLVKNNLI